MHPTPNPPVRARRRLNPRDDRGEGVISTAIAVLIMAFLGAAMWVTFNGLWGETASNTEDQVQIIGDPDAAPVGDAPEE